MIAISAKPGDLETLAALAYRAFHDKPFYSWCFGEQNMLATDPLQQRKGIARSLIGSMMEQASALRLPVYFETDSELNLTIYARLGFDVIDSFSPANGPRMWSLQSTWIP